MRAITTFVAVCLLAAVAEGFFEGFPNMPRFPEVSFIRPLPLPQPPRLPGPFQPPPLPQPPYLPVIGPGFANFGPAIPFPVIPDLDDVTDAAQRGGTFSGISVSSASDGKDGMTIITVNENGEKRTYFSPSPSGGTFFSIPPSPPRAFGIPRIPEFKMPEFPKLKPFKPIEFKPIKFKPIDINTKPSSSENFEGHAVSSSYHMSSENGGKPKIVSELHSITNKNGKIEKNEFKYEN